MIGRLTGKVVDVSVDSLLIDVQGVGYEVHCPNRVLSGFPAGDGRMVSLTIETVVREDLIRLYGFTNGAERDWFRLLQSVQGVGAKVALAILSILDPDELARASALQDHAAFARAQGVGPKLAKRIVTELKDKAPAAAAPVPAGRLDASSGPVPSNPEQEAVSGLVNLGYSQGDAARAVSSVAGEADSPMETGALIREALRRLA